MGQPALIIDKLSKQYRIGAGKTDKNFREALVDLAAAPFRRLKSFGQSSHREEDSVWALKDISLEVQPGDVLGIIGKNGAGKSTLLKVLSRITDPTEGQAVINGRVASLLEVGTGFHRELTGRENIYLSGAILGMAKREIDRKFDEITEFAGIGKFLDTPVKRYSSGMGVRLGFAVAAHLDPEILIIDEVLAVGDVQFQKKCLGKMRDVATGEGRTVLFVSHNMAAVQQLTHRCVLLDEGQIVAIGEPAEIVQQYMNRVMDFHTTVYEGKDLIRPFSHLTQEIEFLRVELEDYPAKLIPADADIPISITVKAREKAENFRFSVSIDHIDGSPVGTMFGPETHTLDAGEEGTFRVVLQNLRLAPGRYSFKLVTGYGNPNDGFKDVDFISDVLHFEVVPPAGDGQTQSFWSQSWGAIRFETPLAERIG